jgi:hypothetical protein
VLVFACEAGSLIQRIAFARYSSEHERFFKQRLAWAASVASFRRGKVAKRVVEMSQGTLEFTGGHAFELTRINRALAQLARPGSREEWLSPLSRADLVGLGVFAGARAPLRHELIERLWSRKRELLRQAANTDGWGPEFPVA